MPPWHGDAKLPAERIGGLLRLTGRRVRHPLVDPAQEVGVGDGHIAPAQAEHLERGNVRNMAPLLDGWVVMHDPAAGAVADQHPGRRVAFIERNGGDLGGRERLVLAHVGPINDIDRRVCRGNPLADEAEITADG